MSIEETLRAIVRDEVRAALAVAQSVPAAAEYLTMSEAANVAKLSYSTIKSWIRSGRLLSDGEGRARRIRPDQLRAAISWTAHATETPAAVAARVLKTVGGK